LKGGVISSGKFIGGGGWEGESRKEKEGTESQTSGREPSKQRRHKPIVRGGENKKKSKVASPKGGRTARKPEI